MGVYTTLEGHINYKGRLPKDSLGNPIIYQGVQFLDENGLVPLNRYMAATFLCGQYDDENCYTLPVDAAMLRKALTDFRGCDECRHIMQDPFERAIQWLEAKQDNEQRLLSYNVS